MATWHFVFSPRSFKLVGLLLTNYFSKEQSQFIVCITIIILLLMIHTCLKNPLPLALDLFCCLLFFYIRCSCSLLPFPFLIEYVIQGNDLPMSTS